MTGFGQPRCQWCGQPAAHSLLFKDRYGETAGWAPLCESCRLLRRAGQRSPLGIAFPRRSEVDLNIYEPCAEVA